MRFAGLLLIAAGLCYAADYDGPRPQKRDVPYILHATKLIETEVAEAKEESKKDDVTYVISGGESPVKTPMAEPIFIFESDKIPPDKIELYKLDVRNGRREVTINQKKRKGPRPYRLLVTRLGDRLYKIEASETLENGQYSLSPSDSNKAFCFEVY
jgi:hypothetical protein